MRRGPVLAALLVLLAILFPPASARAGETEFRLENGLRATLLPTPAGTRTALVVLYDFGELTDPEGKSGMAHLMEHLYVTAAAGEVPARTAEEWMAAHPPPSGANAQTGSDYTVIATVFLPEDLDAQLADAALRMSALEPTEEILAREKRRLVLELANMFDRMPALAAMNRAGERARPKPAGGRKGGVPEQVASITLEEARERLAAYYRPANARLLLAGPMPGDARARIEAAFGDLPAGERAPAPRSRAPARPGGIVDVRSGAPGLAGVASMAFAVPAAGEPLHPAFVLLASRAMTDPTARPRPGGVPPIVYRPVDEPGVIRVNVSVGEEPAEEIAARLRELAEELLLPGAAADPAGARAASRQVFALLFGLSGFRTAMNPYGAAFARGRADQMGIDPEELRERLDAVTAEELSAAAEELFAPERGAIAIVRPAR